MNIVDKKHNILTRSYKDNTGTLGSKDTIYIDKSFDKLLGVIDDIIGEYGNKEKPYAPMNIVGALQNYFFKKHFNRATPDPDIDIYFNDKFNDVKHLLYQLYTTPTGNTIRKDHIKKLNINNNKRLELEAGILNIPSAHYNGLFHKSLPAKASAKTQVKLGEKYIVIDVDLDKWMWSLIRDKAIKAKEKNITNEFDKLFASDIKNVPSAKLDFIFINKNGKLFKQNKDGSEVPYDFETMRKDYTKVQGIVKNLCDNTGLDDNQCATFMNDCAFGINKASHCEKFMTSLNGADFITKITNLDHIDPTIITRVVVSFDWPQVWNPKLKVNELKAVRDWLNPEKYSDAKDKKNIKLLVENLNLLAFFDAIKSTTDKFPAILNPGHSGSSHGENTFERNVRLSQFGLASIKPYRYTGALKINASENMLLQTKKIVNDYYARSAIRFGIELAPNMGGVTLRALSGMRGGAVDIVEQEVARMKEVAGGPEYVYTADILTKLWERLTSDLADNHGMDVQNMKNEVNAYLNQLSTLQEKTLYAIAYVQVFTEQLQQREQDNEPLESNVLTVANLKELVEARNKLIKKNFGKDMNLFDMLQQILVKLKNKN